MCVVYVKYFDSHAYVDVNMSLHMYGCMLKYVFMYRIIDRSTYRIVTRLK